MNTIPKKISVAPMKSIVPQYDEVAIITTPLKTAITTEALSFCINLTVHNTVKYIEKPVTSITPHCNRLGTMM